MGNVQEIIKLKNRLLYLQYSKTLSVSKCLATIKKPFEQEKMAIHCYNKGFNDPNSKYYNMAVEDIIRKWNNTALESLKYGKLSDTYIEYRMEKPNNLLQWVHDNNVDTDVRLYNLCVGFDEFYKALTSKTDFKYVTREQKVFIKSRLTNNVINGRFDCLFYNLKFNKYAVIDWKTSGSIDNSNKYENLLGPANFLQACNLNEYSILVYMYKKALAETYNICNEQNIDVYICLFTLDKEKPFILYKPLFDYDSEFLDSIIDYCYKNKITD